MSSVSRPAQTLTVRRAVRADSAIDGAAAVLDEGEAGESENETETFPPASAEPLVRAKKGTPAATEKQVLLHRVGCRHMCASVSYECLSSLPDKSRGAVQIKKKEADLDKTQEKIDKIENDLANGVDLRPSDKKTKEASLDKAHKKAEKLMNELKNLKAELERRKELADKAPETEPTDKSGGSWSTEERLRLVELVHSQQVQRAFNNHVNTFKQVWEDIGKQMIQARRQQDPERPVAAYERQYKDLLMRFKQFSAMQAGAEQSGSPGEWPAPQAQPWYMPLVTEAFIKLGVHKRVDVTPPLQVDLFSLQDGGRVNTFTDAGGQGTVLSTSQGDAVQTRHVPGFNMGMAGKGAQKHGRHETGASKKLRQEDEWAARAVTLVKKIRADRESTTPPSSANDRQAFREQLMKSAEASDKVTKELLNELQELKKGQEQSTRAIVQGLQDVASTMATLLGNAGHGKSTSTSTW